MVGKQHSQKSLVLCHLQGSEWKVGEMAAKVVVPGLKPGRQVSHGALGLLLFGLLLHQWLE